MQDVNRAPTVRPISIVLVVRYLPLALLTPLSALCVEAVAQPQDESIEIQVDNSGAAALIKSNSRNQVRAEDSADQSEPQTLNSEISEGNDSIAIDVIEPLILSQSNDSNSESEDDQEQEDSW